MFYINFYNNNLNNENMQMYLQLWMPKKSVTVVCYIRVLHQTVLYLYISKTIQQAPSGVWKWESKQGFNFSLKLLINSSRNSIIFHTNE